MVKIVAHYIKNLDTRTIRGSTALHYACNFQLVEITKLLLDKGADPNIIEYELDFHPIFYAVVQNNLEITKMLINKRAQIGHQDYLGNTVIHYAIMNKHIAILDYIINHYHIVRHKGNIYSENINTVLENVIDPTMVNIDGLSIVHLILYEYREVFDIYLAKFLTYADMNAQDNNGNTALHLFAQNSSWEKFASVLPSKKLNIYIGNNQRKTVFDMVQLKDRDLFIDIVSKSYLHYLRKHAEKWQFAWQNACSRTSTNAESNISDDDCLKQIREEIAQKKISVPKKSRKKLITVAYGEVVTFSTFTGSLLDVICGFKYLLKQYEEVATLFHGNRERNIELDKFYQSIGIQENAHQHIMYFEIRWIYQRLFMPPGIESIISKIVQNKRYKYIVIPIGIILSNGNHANGLFYDIDQHILERFEPHGSGYPSQFNYNPDLLDEMLLKKFNSMMANIYGEQMRIKYYQPRYYLPKIGFQTLENLEISINKNIGDPNGFCALWVIWYLDNRLHYHDVKPSTMIRKLVDEIKRNNYSFRNIIRNYSKNITKLRDIYLGKIDRNINDYLNNKLTDQELKQLLIEILIDT